MTAKRLNRFQSPWPRDAFTRAQIVVLQEMHREPKRKTTVEEEIAGWQTYMRCIQRLANDPAALALLRRYRLAGFYTARSIRQRDAKTGRVFPATLLSPATHREAEQQHLKRLQDRQEWRQRRKWQGERSRQRTGKGLDA